MTENFLIDIFLGLLIFSVWLNIQNGKLFQILNQFTEQTKNRIIYSLIICSPLMFDILLNLNRLFPIEKKLDSTEEFTASIFLISSTSTILTILIREYIVSLKEIADIKEAIFWELYNNYKSLHDLIENHDQLQKSGFKDEVNLDSLLWENIIDEMFARKAYETHLPKIKSKHIYRPDIFNEIQRIYLDVYVIVQNIKKNKIEKSYLRRSIPHILESIQNILNKVDYPSAIADLVGCVNKM